MISTRPIFAILYFVGAIVVLVDAAEQLVDALGELLADHVISVGNETEGNDENAA